MEISVPEELCPQKVYDIVGAIQTKHPKIFAELVDLKHLTSMQKLRILDNLLMDHPDLYCSFFEQGLPER